MLTITVKTTEQTGSVFFLGGGRKVWRALSLAASVRWSQNTSFFNQAVLSFEKYAADWGHTVSVTAD
jgi:hypothetical protein